jgi:hypothetical protein
LSHLYRRRNERDRDIDIYIYIEREREGERETERGREREREKEEREREREKRERKREKERETPYSAEDAGTDWGVWYRLVLFYLRLTLELDLLQQQCKDEQFIGSALSVVPICCRIDPD